MILFRLALGSLLSRAMTVALTVVAIALSVALFLGVENLRDGARTSFTDTISDTDLIVGARSGPVQLMLYSVFRIGNATNNMGWDSYQMIAARPEVEWAVPISLGDSHRQFRVMGTTNAYFDRYKFRGGQSLEMAAGTRFSDLFDTVIGADVAQALDYKLGDPIVVAHGLASFSKHGDLPFRVSGILAKTGTPVDRTVIVSLDAIEAIHIDWQSGARKPGASTPAETLRGMTFEPESITAALVGVSSRLQIFRVQRAINEHPGEPLLAVLPGVALQELWQIVGVAETALRAVSVMVVATALLGMAAMIFSGLNERRREMAILRAVGAPPGTIFGLLATEAMLMAASGWVLGMAILYAGLAALQPVLDSLYGIYLPITAPSSVEALTGLAVIGAAGLVSLAPSLRAYAMSLADGMVVKH